MNKPRLARYGFGTFAVEGKEYPLSFVSYEERIYVSCRYGYSSWGFFDKFSYRF